MITDANRDQVVDAFLESLREQMMETYSFNISMQREPQRNPFTFDWEPGDTQVVTVELRGMGKRVDSNKKP